ncbi:hypothetical protein GCM10027446_11300 [Angustibacter peucedani]
MSTDAPRTSAADAKADWDERIYRRTEAGSGTDVVLPAPADLVATAGQGHVALSWSPVDGAAGYVVSRATSPDGEFTVLDHGNSDVPPVPDPWYSDAGVETGTAYSYRVQATPAADLEPGEPTEPVTATPTAESAAPLAVQVDAGDVTGRLQRVWEMVGSERLSQLWLERDDNGNPVGAEFDAALRQAHAELGVKRVRAHAIFHDDVDVLTWPEGGQPQFHFDGVDRIVDQVLATGIRPVLELGFMPKDLASDPSKTCFQYEGIVSPPTDWQVWADLNGALARHLVERYGIDEVAGWGFEVWNEPNLEVFWTGTKLEYLRLYEEAARAIKAVDDRLLVGGPATAASEWVEDICAYCAERDVPLDFVSTHTYGNAPVDVHPSLRRHGFDKAQVWWTEWGVGHTHFHPVHDTAFAAPFVLHGYKSAQDRVDALAYWVVSDHFEELGRPPRLLHGGFGLLTVGNLRKPRYWAVALAEQLGDEVVASRVSGDGATTLVETWATRHDDGTVDVLLWNVCPDATQHAGRDDLARTIALQVDGLAAAAYDATVARVDNEHSSIDAHVASDTVWPDAAEWERLRGLDVLHTEDVDATVTPDGRLELELRLPMPGIARLRLAPRG